MISEGEKSLNESENAGSILFEREFLDELNERKEIFFEARLRANDLDNFDGTQEDE